MVEREVLLLQSLHVCKVFWHCCYCFSANLGKNGGCAPGSHWSAEQHQRRCRNTVLQQDTDMLLRWYRSLILQSVLWFIFNLVGGGSFKINMCKQRIRPVTVVKVVLAFFISAAVLYYWSFLLLFDFYLLLGSVNIITCYSSGCKVNFVTLTLAYV